jgi:hypothetical protein
MAGEFGVGLQRVRKQIVMRERRLSGGRREGYYCSHGARPSHA